MNSLKAYREEMARARGFSSHGLTERAEAHRAKALLIREALQTWAENQLQQHDHVCQGSCRKCAQAFNTLRALTEEG